MRTTLRVLALCLVFLFTATLVGDQASTQVHPKATSGAATPCGRFQLFQGTWGLPGTVEKDMLLRMDTENGHTWVYFSAGTGDQHREGWIDVDEWHPPNSPTK